MPRTAQELITGLTAGQSGLEEAVRLVRNTEANDLSPSHEATLTDPLMMSIYQRRNSQTDTIELGGARDAYLLTRARLDRLFEVTPADAIDLVAMEAAAQPRAPEQPAAPPAQPPTT